MATYNASDLSTRRVRSASERDVVVPGSVSVSSAIATGDKLYFGKIPAGTDVFRLGIINTSLGTTVPIDFGFEPIDGSTPNTTAFYSAFAAQTANANGASKLMTPVRVEKDSYLVGTVGTVSAGGTGTISAVLEGVGIGAK